jgi:diguanylate cyclase (GGDEF)-like protein
MYKNEQLTCPLHNSDCQVLTAHGKLHRQYDLLLKQSHNDPLTGYYNYGYLIDALNKEMERTRRSGISTAIIITDIDHFKRVNDTLGHEAGNQALKWATSLWREAIRTIDTPCRYGGEEFVFILPSCNLPAAIQVAERLRREMIRNPVILNGHPTKLTASFGVEEFTRNQEWPDAKSIIEGADRFLYQAKENGRNQTCYDLSKIIPPSMAVTADERNALFS